MSALPVDSGELPTIDTRKAFDKVRLRLSEAVTALLRPLPTHADLLERVRSVASELEEIQHDLLLVYHVTAREEALLHEVDEMGRRIDDGWVPEGKPLAEVMDRLRPLVND